MRGSKKKTRTCSCGLTQWLVFLSFCLFCLPLPAMAEDFDTTKDYTETGSNGDDHRLNDAGTTITVGQGVEYTLSGAISGSGSLTKAGSGTLNLRSSDNTYTGGTIVTGGTLNINAWTNSNADSLDNAVSGNGSELYTTSNLQIGYNGNGALTVTDYASARAGTDMYLGYMSGSSGLVTVDGTDSELNVERSLYVGRGGDGALNVTSGAKVTAGSQTHLGYDANSSGTVTVSGDGSELSTGTSLFVGLEGNGVLNVTNGAKVMSTSQDNSITIGRYEGSSGTVTVSGDKSELNAGNFLYVGREGNGVLNITDRAKATATGFTYLGDNSGSSGTVTVSGAGSELAAENNLYVGRGGNGELNIADGAKVTVKPETHLGYNSGSSGTVTVSGHGSELSTGTSLFVGREGNGVLNITNGAKVMSTSQDNSITIGFYSGFSGCVTVSGDKSELNAGNFLYVGRGGNGVLNITDGAKVTATGITYLGDNSGSSGTVTVSGAGSELNAQSDLYVGASGAGSLNITDGGTATAARISVNDQSSITVSGAGTLGGGAYAGNIANNGVVTFNQTVNQTLSGVISGAGSLTKAGSGALTLSGESTYTGGTTITGGLVNFTAPGLGAGAITLDGGGLQWALGNSTDISARLTDIGANGATFDTNGQNVSFANALSGSGGITKAGSGALILNGESTYTGLTTVRGGVLELGSDLTSSSGLSLYNGATFRTNGKTHDLNGKTLSVWDNATYEGDLNAQSATLNFTSSAYPVTGSMLNVIGNADINNSSVNLNVFGDTALSVGDTVSLLKTTGDLTAAAVALSDGSSSIRAGATLVYTIALILLPDELQATIESGRTTEQAKALSEGMLSGMALTLQGADLAAGQGMNAAAQAARNAAATGGGYSLGGFAATSGGSVRYNSGSHVDMNSVSALAGLSFGADLAPGRLTLGAFFEFGNGSYDTHNSFNNAPSVNGEGSTRYAGGGIMGRMDAKETGPGHAYTEASARAGRTHNDYTGSDLRDSFGRKAEYESASNYYSLHLGAGYVFEITEKAALDLHAKYFWTRQEGDGVSLSTGESVRFNSLDSHRARLGARFEYSVNEYVSPYAGAAFEREFDGRARAAVNGHSINTPDLKGNTGIGELGLCLTPSQTLPLSFELGVQGYTGKREGVTGSLQARFEF